MSIVPADLPDDVREALLDQADALDMRLNDYLSALAAGQARRPMSVLRPAGVDVVSPTPWVSSPATPAIDAVMFFATVTFEDLSPWERRLYETKLRDAARQETAA